MKPIRRKKRLNSFILRYLCSEFMCELRITLCHISNGTRSCSYAAASLHHRSLLASVSAREISASGHYTRGRSLRRHGRRCHCRRSLLFCIEGQRDESNFNRLLNAHWLLPRSYLFGEDLVSAAYSLWRTFRRLRISISL